MAEDSADLYLGLISGTSADGIDAALASFADGRVRTLAAQSFDYRAELRRAVLALARTEAQCSLDEIGQLDNAVGHAFADAATALLQQADVDRARIRAIGSHGQTIRHRLDLAEPFTIQVGNPNVIAERTGLTVVADFRRRDVAAGGQGAPLAPGFHAAALAGAAPQVVLNLGGIANLTWLAPGEPVIGFDAGPANALLDAHAERALGQPVDRDATLARRGQVVQPLLARMMDDPYLALPPPKSTGREYFNIDWLDGHLAAAGMDLSAADLQRTLVEFSARSTAAALALLPGQPLRVLACGGGVHNPLLMARLGDLVAPATLATTADCGIDPDFVEALAFAWLARQTLAGQSGNLPTVTGAAAPRVLGGIYPA